MMIRYLFSILVLMLIVQANSHAANICPTNLTAFNFTNPVDIVNHSGGQGHVYRFSNVLEGVDAEVTVISEHGAYIHTVDSSNHSPPGEPSALQPDIKQSSFDDGDHYVDLEIKFLHEGTNNLYSFAGNERYIVSALDVDGSGNSHWYRKEFVGFQGFSRYVVESNTLLDIGGGSFTEFVNSDGISEAGVSTTATRRIVTSEYEGQSEIVVRLGIRTHNANSHAPRFFSLYFKCINFTDPNIEVNHDYGDAPASYGDAEHLVTSDLYLGNIPPDAEGSSAHSYNATGDGDEDDGAPRHSVGSTAPYLFPILKESSTSYSTEVTVTNNTGSASTLFAWIDFDKNGTFDADEATSVVVNSGTTAPVTLNWSSLPNDLQLGTTFIRLRLTSDPAVTLATPANIACDGEVEDYMIAVAQDIPANSNDLIVAKDIERRGCETVIFQDNFDDLPSTGTYIGANRPGHTPVRNWDVSGGGSDTYAGTLHLDQVYAASLGYTIEDFGTSIYLGNGAVRRVYPSIIANGLSFDDNNRLTTIIEAMELRDDADDATPEATSTGNKASDWGPQPVKISRTFDTIVDKRYRLYFKALPELGQYLPGIVRVDTPRGSVHLKTPGFADGKEIKYSVEFVATEISSTISFVNYGHIDAGSSGWCAPWDNPWCTVDGNSSNHNELTLDDVVLTEENANCSRCSIGDTRTGVYSSSSVQINNSRLKASSRLYQAKFGVAKWQGILTSHDLKITNDNTNGTLKNEKWDAENELPAHSLRNILSYNASSNNGIDFNWTNLTGSIASVRLLNWIRGDRSHEKTDSNPQGTFRDRGSRILGDIIHSSPLHVGAYANFGYVKLAGAEGSSYAAFLAAKRSRTAMVYVGANDGMLHGFNASSGAEEFAFIPNEILPKFDRTSNPQYGCREDGCLDYEALVDGSLTVGDVYLSNAWRSVLLGTLGEGGKGLFALNVSDPTNFDAAKVMWEISASQTAYANYLGMTTSEPSIVRLHNGTWAAVIGNGAGSAGYKAALLLIDISNGQLIKVIDTGVGDVNTPNGLSSPIPIDINGDRITDFIYAGDLLGNLWKFDVTNSASSNWSVAYTASSLPVPLFTACETNACSKKQAITAKPQVGKHPSGGYMVYFGTGQYRDLRDNVLGSPNTETLYGIRDNGAPIAGLNDLVEQTVLQESTISSALKARVTSNNPVNYASKKGWYLKLLRSGTAEGERVTSQALLRGGRLILTTLIPPTNCSWGGSNWLIEINAINGQRLAVPALDINNDRRFNNGDKVIYSSQSVVPSAVQDTLLGMVTRSPVIIKHSAHTEGKYISGSSGRVGLFRESSSRISGRQTWEQRR